MTLCNIITTNSSIITYRKHHRKTTFYMLKK